MYLSLFVTTTTKFKSYRNEKVLFEIVTTLTRLMAPILAFTSEEIWQHIPAFEGKEDSVHLSAFPESDPKAINEALSDRWEKFKELRSDILKSLEEARQNKIIGNSLEAKIIFTAADEPLHLLESFEPHLMDLLQVSEIEWSGDISEKAKPSSLFPSLFIEIEKASGSKCERCWKWRNDLGSDSHHPTICKTCTEALTA